MLFPVYASDAWTDLLSVLNWSTNHYLQPNSLEHLYMLIVCLSQLLCTGGTHPKIPPALYRQNLSTPDLDYWSRFFFFFFSFRAAAFGNSQARGQMGAAAVGLHHSHCNNPSWICNLHRSSQQCQILNPLSGARDWTHILMHTSQVPFCWTPMGTLRVALLALCLRCRPP